MKWAYFSKQSIPSGEAGLNPERPVVMAYELSDNQVLGIGLTTFVVAALGYYLLLKTGGTDKKPVALSQYHICKNQLESVSSKMEQGLVKQIDTYYDEFEGLKDEDKQYKLNYFQEELLKELIKLDDVDLTELSDSDERQELKLQRKQYIKRIQGLLKDLDDWKSKVRV